MNISLYGKEYFIPGNILNLLKQQDGQRVDNLIKNKKISYSLLKKMKSDIESGISDYGPEVKSWINSQLRNGREDVYDIKKSQMDIGMENRFLKPHSKDKNKNPTQTSGIDTKHKEFLREDKKVIRLTESQLKQIIENIIDEYETIK